ncbi:MAG: prolipoprotein diacylglyceryl transferase, partial [Paracoccaceae bacterium]
MSTGIPFPNISPEIFAISLGSFDFALRWYALAYIVGIVLGWRLAVRAVRRPDLWKNQTPV